MSTLQVMSLRLLPSSSSSSSNCARRVCDRATLYAPKHLMSHISLPNIPTTILEKPKIIRDDEFTIATTSRRNTEDSAAPRVISELYAIAEIAVERAEMHANIGEQRNNWNNLLLNSVNAITLTAAMMAGLAAASVTGTPVLALKLSSALLYTAATGMLLVVNKIQPSQLAEEQRNAARLFRQLHEKIKSTLALGTPTPMDVKDAMEKVLAIDKAYPLPLLGGMLNKFPEIIEPTVWWPRQQLQQGHGGKLAERNGWSNELEEEMKEVVGVLKRKDTSEYLRFSKMVLKFHRTLAILGPILTGLAALGSTLVGSPMYGSFAVVFAVVAGSLASVVNTLEHGGQVGMVFELYRNCAGFYQFLEDSIESTLKEREAGKRENGELFEIKVALELGRSLSELRDLASASSSCRDRDGTSQFAGKLF